MSPPRWSASGPLRAAADASGVPMFINARWRRGSSARNVPAERALDEVRDQRNAYEDAGADGLFLPGLIDLATIEAVVAATALPLNVMVMPGLPSLEHLAAAGVRRISQGGASFLAASGMLHATTAAYLGGEAPPAGADGRHRPERAARGHEDRLRHRRAARTGVRSS